MAALMQDHKWMIHPMRKIQAMAEPTKKRIAARMRP
jgi:hypothetical protein